MLCHYCGTSNENDAAFCINCGESLSPFRNIKKLLSKRWFHARLLLDKVYLLRSLFDVSFEHLVSIKMIKWIYGLSMLSAGLVALLCIIAGFRASAWFGIFMAVVGAPLMFLILTLYSRVLLEMVLVHSRKVDPQIKTEKLPDPLDNLDNIEWNV